MIYVHSYQFETTYDFAAYFRFWLDKYGGEGPDDCDVERLEDFNALKAILAELEMTALECIELERPPRYKGSWDR